MNGTVAISGNQRVPGRGCSSSSQRHARKSEEESCCRKSQRSHSQQPPASPPSVACRITAPWNQMRLTTKPRSWTRWMPLCCAFSDEFPPPATIWNLSSDVPAAENAPSALAAGRSRRADRRKKPSPMGDCDGEEDEGGGARFDDFCRVQIGTIGRNMDAVSGPRINDRASISSDFNM